MTSKIEISHRTIIFTVALLMGLWLILQIRDILFLLFIAFILMSALRPLVELFVRVKVPRMLGILLLYSVIFGFFGFSLAGAIPSLVTQSTKFIHELPIFVTRVLPYWDIDVRSMSQQIAPISENLVKVTVGIFSNVITTLTVLVFTFYFLLERRHIEVFLSSTIGEGAARQTLDVVETIEQRLGAWVRGELFLMFCVGLFSYIGLTFLHIDYALPLAIIAGLLEIVPMVGPLLSAIPAVLVALASSPFLALSVVALFFIVQQVENNLIVPFVMKKSIGMSPLVTIVSLMIGGKLLGVAGAILAVPVVLVIQTIIGSMLLKKSKDA